MFALCPLSPDLVPSVSISSIFKIYPEICPLSQLPLLPSSSKLCPYPVWMPVIVYQLPPTPHHLQCPQAVFHITAGVSLLTCQQPLITLLLKTVPWLSTTLRMKFRSLAKACVSCLTWLLSTSTISSFPILPSHVIPLQPLSLVSFPKAHQALPASRHVPQLFFYLKDVPPEHSATGSSLSFRS